MSRWAVKINPGKPLPHRLRLDVLRRLLLRTVESEQVPDGYETPCWLWQGTMDKRGYGQIKINGVARWVHRVSHELFHGPVPEGKDVDHGCHCPACWNPEHLSNQSPSVNRRRRRRKPELASMASMATGGAGDDSPDEIPF